MSSILRAACVVLLVSPLAAQAPCFEWRGGLANQGIDQPSSFTGTFRFLVCDDGSGAGSRLLAGGHFSSIGGVAAANRAAWNGTNWAQVGGGASGFPGYLPFMGGVPDEVSALCMHDEGSGSALYVGGAYTSVGGQNCTGIARWNGSSWTVLPGVEAMAIDMASFDDGGGPALFVAGYLHRTQLGTDNDILYWRGGAWHAFSSPPGVVFALCVFDDGSGARLYAAGSVAGSLGISRWDGTQWSGVGGGFNNSAYALCVHDDGSGAKLYAAGTFTQAGGQPANRIARWDGTSWSAVGNGFGPGAVLGLTSFPEGFGGASKLIASGTFLVSGNTTVNGIAAFDGTSWSALGSGLGGVANNMNMAGLAVFDDGRGSGRDLYVGGQFSSAGGQAVSSFAKWEGCGGTGTPFCAGDGSLATSCPCANFGATGHGCASSMVAAGAVLGASGLPSPDTIVLAASELRPGASCIFLQGDAQLPGGAHFGDGLRCANGQLLRLGLKSATNGNASYPEAGDPSIRVRAAALGAPIGAHASRYYQVYYRDSDSGFCPAPQGNTWNITNALRIVW